MADSTTNIPQLLPGESSPETRLNELFDAASAAMVYGRNAATCTGRVFGYLGGRWGGDVVANGDSGTLTASTTQYMVVDRSDGSVSFASTTTNWDDAENYARAYKLTVGTSSITAYEDHRAGAGGTLAGAGGGDGGGGGIPQNSQSTAYTLVLADANKHILHPSADTTARTFTIPANGSVAFDVGTAVTFVNQNAAGVITIAITSDTMRLAGAGTTGSRTLAANGIATALKITSTEWIISGAGLT